MKHLLAVLAICLTTWGCTPSPATCADAPQPGTLEMALTKSTVTVGEPLILKYRVSNPEGRRTLVAIDNDLSRWLTIRMSDASGHPVRGVLTVGEATHFPQNYVTTGVPIGPKDHHEGLLVLSPSYRPTQPGRYQLDLTAHLTYRWGLRDAGQADSEAQQSYSLPLLVTARAPRQLRAVAEGLRRTVLGTKNLDQYRLADKALFAMRDPACLPTWQALATDTNLDPWQAVDVMHQLQDVGSVSACDILAAMQGVAPERWRQTGTSPLSVLESMWRPAGPGLKQHINQLLEEAGVPEVTEHTKLLGVMH